ncbi:hypothetical protein L226DRAFT_533713 [Lentinus tigrinus ALCF2SS1-7]|uniref:RTA1-domain-containing protein n=1 Tax=Lentinus tigrinus ALCF2SS1-6 TaxID=1328759 RepID=A0A5C2SKZ9_9APHY|nr:hypothetical protein L227DRAFT_650591 [Lentinus tigrinus ALCF2SS1-6]RPD76654.1 hypothetical protein L226DRAFT_533713 [Lentinus tigrinus ALCF2SS1-7]
MARPNFPIDEAYLIAGWLESFFWGFYTLLFGMSMYAIYQKRRDGINVFTTVSILLLYLLATTHMSLALVRLIQGFIFYRDTIGPILYFANISVRLNMAKDYIYITNLVLGDLVVVWRLYVVWGKNIWVVVAPLIMIAGELISGYGAISQWLLPHPNPPTMVKWGTAMYVLSMATNILVTAAIASRIWYVTRRTQAVLGVEGNNRYSRVILLIVESGALIAAAKLIEFTLFKLAPVDGLNGLNAMYMIYESMPQITGLVPTAIVYAVNNGFTNQDDYYTSRGPRSTLVFGSRFATATEPTAYDNRSLSTVGFASPSPDDVTKRRKRVPQADEKIELPSRSSASVVESPV